MTDDEVVFVFGPNRGPLNRQDAKALNEWIRWDNALAVRDHLQKPLKHAIESGGNVTVPDNNVTVPDNKVREALLAILDKMDEAGEIDTDGLCKLHEVARLPIAGGG